MSDLKDSQNKILKCIFLSYKDIPPLFTLFNCSLSSFVELFLYCETVEVEQGEKWLLPNTSRCSYKYDKLMFPNSLQFFAENWTIRYI